MEGVVALASLGIASVAVDTSSAVGMTFEVPSVEPRSAQPFAGTLKSSFDFPSFPFLLSTAGLPLKKNRCFLIHVETSSFLADC